MSTERRNIPWERPTVLPGTNRFQRSLLRARKQLYGEHRESESSELVLYARPRRQNPRLICHKHMLDYAEDNNVVELNGNEHLCDDCRDDPLNPSNNERGGL